MGAQNRMFLHGAPSPQVLDWNAWGVDRQLAFSSVELATMPFNVSNVLVPKGRDATTVNFEDVEGKKGIGYFKMMGPISIENQPEPKKALEGTSGARNHGLEDRRGQPLSLAPRPSVKPLRPISASRSRPHPRISTQAACIIILESG